jgi:hypothetical protein
VLARIVAILLVVIGIVWMLQGFNILPGSFMTGQLEWAAYGALSVAVGVALFFWRTRGRS